jgi:hypothetical protein
MWPAAIAIGMLMLLAALGSARPAQAGIQEEDGVPAVWWIDSIFGLDDECDNEGNLIANIADAGDDFEELDVNDEIVLPADGGEVWICVELDEEGDPGGNADYDQVDFDSDDYGTFEDALCAAEDDSDSEFEVDDDCEDADGLGTDSLEILCNTPDDDSECQADGGGGDVAVLFVCEEDPGIATITIGHDIDAFEGDSPDQVMFTIICYGPADDAEIEAITDRVQIVPALGDVQYSLIVLTLLDENGDAAIPGSEITWSTDNCQISEDYFDEGQGDELSDAIDIFEEWADNMVPSNAEDVEDFVENELNPDWNDETNLIAFDDDAFDGDFDGDTLSAVILDCGQGQDSEPGVAEVCAVVEVEDDPDLTFCVEVTVVGPPAAPLVVAADQTSVRCGERAQITVTVKDAEGQPVSDHTVVEAVTNFGGVLGGTGAVAGEFGLVTPISSTLAETFDGVATFWLLTSETHSGPYEVLISTGGGGSVAGQELGGLFSTPVVNGRVSVACTIPAAAPAPAATIKAPSTGQGITPPSTGDAGLVATDNGSSAALFVLAGVAAFALAGVATLKFARR